MEDGGVDVPFTGDVLVDCHGGLGSPHHPVLAVDLLESVGELHLHPTQGRPGTTGHTLSGSLMTGSKHLDGSCTGSSGTVCNEFTGSQCQVRVLGRTKTLEDQL